MQLFTWILIGGVGITLLPLVVDTVMWFFPRAPLRRVVGSVATPMVVISLYGVNTIGLYCFFKAHLPFFLMTFPKLSILKIPLSIIAIYLYIIILYHYTKCIFSNPGYYVGKPIDTHQNADAKTNENQIPNESKEEKDEQEQRVCLICKHIKKSGVHHCSACGKCVELMDHHCPFTANCVGKNTYKHFMFLLLFEIIGELFAALMAAPAFFSCREGVNIPTEYKQVHFWIVQCRELGIHSIEFLPACFLFFVTNLLFSFHCWLLTNKTTTIDFYRHFLNHGISSLSQIKKSNKGVLMLWENETHFLWFAFPFLSLFNRPQQQKNKLNKKL